MPAPMMKAQLYSMHALRCAREVQLFRDNDKMLEMREFHLGALCPAISSRDRSDLCYLLDASATFSHSQTVRDQVMAALCHGRQMQR